MSQVDDTPQEFEHEGIEYTIWPRVNRRDVPLNEFMSDRDEGDMDTLDHEEARFHDTRDVETEKTLTGWTISYDNNSAWLSAKDYDSLDQVIDAVESTIESRGN